LSARPCVFVSPPPHREVARFGGLFLPSSSDRQRGAEQFPCSALAAHVGWVTADDDRHKVGEVRASSD
jgi:hypothetical protein